MAASTWRAKRNYTIKQSSRFCRNTEVQNDSRLSNANIAPTCATAPTNSGGHKRQEHPPYMQNISHQPINVKFSLLPASDFHFNSMPPHYFKTDTALPCNSTLPPTFNNKPPISSFNHTNTYNPLFTTQSNNTQLQQSALNARQSVPKELPIFSGEPEDWPHVVFRTLKTSFAFENL